MRHEPETVEITRELDDCDISRALGCPARIWGEVTFSTEIVTDSEGTGYGDTTVSSLRIDRIEADVRWSGELSLLHPDFFAARMANQPALRTAHDLYYARQPHSGATVETAVHNALVSLFPEIGEESLEIYERESESAHEEAMDCRRRERRAAIA